MADQGYKRSGIVLSMNYVNQERMIMFREMCLDDLYKAQKATETYLMIGLRKSEKIKNYGRTEDGGYIDKNGNAVSKEQIQEAARAINIQPRSIIERIRLRGLTIEEALTTPKSTGYRI